MKTILSSILLFAFCLPSSFAQENDFQSWYAFSVNKKLIKKTNLTFKTGLRYRENSSLLAKQFYDLKVKRKYNKRITYALGYRYISKKDFTFTQTSQNRYFIDLNYKNKLSKRFTYSVRNRGQYSGNVQGYKMVFRQKLALAYNIRKTKLTPSIASEYFLSNSSIDKLRSTIALSYPLAKKLDIDLAYRVQQEFYVNNPQTLFILEGKLAYTL